MRFAFALLQPRCLDLQRQVYVDSRRRSNVSNAQIAVMTPRKVRRAADSAGRCIGGKKLRGSNPIWGATYSACVADVSPRANLAKGSINVGEAASELGVGSADLRRLLWANPKLTDAAVEIEERRPDKAEANIFEALHSDNPRRRDAASMFTIRNSHRARKRGWITTSTGAAELSVTTNAPTRTLTFRWRTSEDDERDAERAERDRLRDEGKTVVAIGWGDGGETIEHKTGPVPSNKD